MKKNTTTLVILLIIIFLFTGCSKTLARADGIEVKQKEVDTYINFLIKSQDTTGEIASNEEKLNDLKVSIIDMLIVIKLLEKYAEENNIIVTNEEIEEELKLVIDNYASEEDFENGLKKSGVDRKFIKDGLKKELLRNKIYNNVTANVIVTDKEVKQYYEDNKGTLFLVPFSVKAGHILAKFPWKKDNSEETQEGREEAKEKIEMIDEKLKNGEDFEELARQYSDDEVSGKSGGDLGYISEGQMVEEFDRALFSLDVGEVSKIIETEFGFHIIKVYEHREEYIQDFDEVKENINSYLLNSYGISKWEDFILSLIDAVDIEYFTDVEGVLNSTVTEKEDSEIPVEEEGE